VLTAQTLRERILQHLAEVGVDSLNGIARHLKVPRSNVRDKLLVAESHGHVRVEKVVERVPTGAVLPVNKIWLTKSGKQWLKANSM